MISVLRCNFESGLYCVAVCIVVRCYSLVTCCCYKLLENPDVAKIRSTRDTVFQLLGVMVKKYNHALSEYCFLIAL